MPIDKPIKKRWAALMGTKLIERGITRYDIESQGTFGYMMRISRDGEHTNEFFSDKKYSGKRKALAASRARYRELVSQLPPPKTTKGVRTHRNQSGVVGVHLSVCESTYGKTYSSYCASWKTSTGARSKISFSFKKYTKKAAWELACIARELETADRAKVERTLRSRLQQKSAKAQDGSTVRTRAKTKSKAKKKSTKLSSKNRSQKS
ncbi:MAG: hypothetical protein GY880_08935 [Planctomycetaceae bacterium]|nr:hypothetical protein [Planctomycetaceae bacterium]